MKQIEITDGDATEVLGDAITGTKRKRNRTNEDRGHTVWMRTADYEALAERAARSGVTVSEMLRNLTSPPSYRTPSALQAAVLVKVADALRGGDVERAQMLVREALRGLAKTHATEVRDDAHAWERGEHAR